MKKLTERLKSPIDPFFTKLQKVAILAGGIGAAILAAPVALPAILTTTAGYLVTFGAVSTAIIQATKNPEQ